MNKKIDIHLHVAYDGLDGYFEPYYFADGAAMKSYMESHGIAHGVLMSGGEMEASFGKNIDVCALAHKYPERFSWLCNIDVDRQEDIVERLAHYKALGAKGVGEFTTNCRLDSPKMETLLDGCQQLELPFLFHMSPKPGFNYGVIDEPGLPLLEKTLSRYPTLKVIGHSQPFWYEIGGDMPTDYESRNQYPEGKVKPGGRLPELFAEYPNLYGDLSANSAGNAVMRDPEFGYAFLEEFQDQLMFGTDMVNTEMRFPLGAFLDDAVETGRISEKAYEKICCKNAIRIFNLKLG
ncbi:amidohydrolase family protein [Anaerotalea alkaliphila]|uniref:Amidohydrolase n=1 Tax=Anaerotalea alkaliphila TaxID=2662126 RepID=A0A7X5HVP4_9FIRM|nr:amidohydrolase family protein [Anaerotalea alkaliphila]NDL67527.1 amidohydrolase [Anaerotalea alkaliphila]